MYETLGRQSTYSPPGYPVLQFAIGCDKHNVCLKLMYSTYLMMIDENITPYAPGESL